MSRISSSGDSSDSASIDYRLKRDVGRALKKRAKIDEKKAKT
jgi:hypothetical protein